MGAVGRRSDAVYQHLLSSVLGNAQLAALEITGGVDPARMPTKLESVRASVRRAAELLEHLAAHDRDSPGRRKGGGDR